MATSQRTNVNPALEELRLKALTASVNTDFQQEIESLIRKTSHVHAGFLFFSPKALQPILRTLSESSSMATDTGWLTLGNKLGLDMSVLKVIQNNQFNEGPVFNVLLNYIQREDATIGKIIRALLEMKRLDVISRSKELILELTKEVLQRNENLMKTSASSSDYGSSESNEASAEVLNETILKPEVIPETPLILRNMQASPLISSDLLHGVTSSLTTVISSPAFYQRFAPETLLQAAPTSGPDTTSPQLQDSVEPVSNTEQKVPCSKKVFLTFTEDGADLAAEVTRILRKQRGCQRIGVLILGEQLRHLQPDPNLFISASVQLVDYIIPILTEGYLRAILRQVPSGTNNCIDAKFVPFIYQNMVQDYTKRGCLNDKVRCLIPDEQIEKVLSHLVMAGPLFAAWEKMSRTDHLAERMLATNA